MEKGDCHTVGKAPTRRLKRCEGYMGIHFDFHASDDCTRIGQNVTREMIEQIIREVQPDFLQCDCKGHRGLSSYPTKVGHPAPGFVKDQLRIWREVTAELGIPLCMHYSGVWDTEALKHHPEWARIDEEGQPDPDMTSTSGPYVDELLIPQLKELCDDYGVDGAWVDGDCWAARLDYGPQVLETFRQETGIIAIPRQPKDPYYHEFREFCRAAFRRYVRHYVNAMHQHNPNFQIASNWAYSALMPEPIGMDVDFISGDLTLQDAVNAARLQGRCLARQEKPWELMSWAFSAKFGEDGASTKSVPQLQQEAAQVIALGGGFSAYFTQKGDGSIRPWQMQLMGEVARFCRARQHICHRAQVIPQIGLVYSSAAFYRESSHLFHIEGDILVPMQGILQALLESQYGVEVLMEHQLSGRMAEYPLLVIPEWGYLTPDFRAELLDYVRYGGNLLIIGPKAAKLFTEELDVTLEGEVREDSVQWLEHDGWLAGLKTPAQVVKLGASARPFGQLHQDNDANSQHQTAASVRELGRGKIAATYFNFGERYVCGKTALSRKFLNGLVHALFPQPLVEVTGSSFVDVIITRSHGRLAVNLLNTAGPHANKQVYVYDEIPAVGPLKIAIRVTNAPRKVVLEPLGTELPHTYTDGEIKLTLPQLSIHDIIIVEQDLLS